MTDPRPVKSLEVYSADFAPGLIVHTSGPEHAYAVRPGCEMTADGEAVDETGLWAWFKRSKGVTVRLATDAESYGAVVRAEFASRLV